MALKFLWLKKGGNTPLPNHLVTPKAHPTGGYQIPYEIYFSSFLRCFKSAMVNPTRFHLLIPHKAFFLNKNPPSQ